MVSGLVGRSFCQDGDVYEMLLEISLQSLYSCSFHHLCDPDLMKLLAPSIAGGRHTQTCVNVRTGATVPTSRSRSERCPKQCLLKGILVTSSELIGRDVMPRWNRR